MTFVRLLKNGEEAFPAMFAAMDRAAASIDLEMYIFADNETGREFRDHLIDAAKRGVRVKVLIDAWGSWNLPDSFWNDFRSAGGMVRSFHPLSRGLFPFRDHRKMLLIDEHVVYLGGLNISDEYYRGTSKERPWRDNALEIIGPEVASLRRSFFRMWGMAESTTAKLVFRLRRDRGTAQKSDVVRFLESGPENMMRPVRKAYRQVIHDAKHSIDLAMGYFYPHGRMLRAFKRAVRRGVRVRLMTPLHTDLPITRWAAHGLYGRLLRAGVEVWEYTPTMMHAKLAIADDTVIAGSANLDVRSGRINYELVAIITDPALAGKARADFEDDLRHSVRIWMEDWKKRSLFQKMKERFSYCLLARFDLIIARREMARKMR
jgi:cardiolipin synthase